MARPFRVDVAGGLYHVIARGNERRNVFRDDADRSRYLTRLAFYREKFSFRVLAYCLMDNHVHLAIETGKIPLPRIMAGLQSSYTQYFNRRHERSGYLFQGRYKAFLVEKDRYALALLRYIHENPVKREWRRRLRILAGRATGRTGAGGARNGWTWIRCFRCWAGGGRRRFGSTGG